MRTWLRVCVCVCCDEGGTVLFPLQQRVPLSNQRLQKTKVVTPCSCCGGCGDAPGYRLDLMPVVRFPSLFSSEQMIGSQACC
jgi:hypothetical protein